MDTDLVLVIGIILAGFAVPPVFGALSEGRAPRTASIMIIAGGVLIYMALNERPYTLEDIPNAFVRVVGRYIN